MRILLVEPDPSTAEFTERALSEAGFHTYVTDSGDEAIELAKIYDYDMILTEMGLPDMDGYGLILKVRRARISTPILVLSGADDVDIRIRALELGADDYLTKPFNELEMVARIHAIVRRSKGHAQSIITTGKIAVNIDTKTVEADGQPVHLTGKEYQTLELLSLRKGSTLSKEMFINHLYGGMDEPMTQSIAVFIGRLRKKLAQATGGANYIETIRGCGYVLRDTEKDT